MKKSFFVILIVLLSGCSKKKTEIPSEVLGHDQMVSVLIDVHLLEAKVRKLYEKPDTSAVIYQHYENMIFEERGITRSQYDQSLEYYLDNLEEYRDIYDEVVDSLLSRQKTKNFN